RSRAAYSRTRSSQSAPAGPRPSRPRRRPRRAGRRTRDFREGSGRSRGAAGASRSRSPDGQRAGARPPVRRRAEPRRRPEAGASRESAQRSSSPIRSRRRLIGEDRLEPALQVSSNQGVAFLRKLAPLQPPIERVNEEEVNGGQIVVGKRLWG